MIGASKNLQKNALLALRITGGASIALALSISVHQYQRLEQLHTELQTRAPLDQARDLQAGVEKLEQALEHIRAQPPIGARSDQEQSQAALKQRIAAMEQALRLQPSTADLETVRNRLLSLESQSRKGPSPPPPVRTKRQPSPRQPLQETRPPFQVVGLELRGNQQLLAILTTGSNSVSDIALLRVGETMSGWQLTRINHQNAEFRFNGDIRILPLP